VGARSPVTEVGAVVAFPPSGWVTVRAVGPEVAPEGTAVTDTRGRLHGRVVRVFGPVRQPYLSVRPRRPPTPAEAMTLLGATIVRE
jgi:rRNA processing protein Gar1